MSRQAILTVSIVAALAMPVVAQDKPAAGEPEAAKSNLPLCPVMGEPVNFTMSLDTDDGPVYVCCKGCIGKLKKDPAKFAEKVAAQRAALAKMDRVQLACPLSGDPIDMKSFAEVDGEKVYTCCNACAGKYAKEPGKYAKGLAASYTYQTKCPVSGGKIDPTAFLEVEGGQKVYFCCKGCPGKFTKDPDKYTESLEEQGYFISADTKGDSKNKESSPG
jgi:YHS domain-containing protein